MRVYIIDDETLAREELKFLLSRYSEIEIVGDAEDLQQVQHEDLLSSIDCLFLDVELQHENGVALAQQLKKIPECPLIVFATAYDQYAFEAFEVDAVDYLLKPFHAERIDKTVQKLFTLYEKRKKKKTYTHVDKITVTYEDRIALLKLQDILYFTSEDSKTIAVTNEKHYFLSDSLTTLEAKLAQQQFMRVHRAYLINTEHIKELEPWGTSKYNIILPNKISVPVSRMYIKSVRQLFNL